MSSLNFMKLKEKTSCAGADRCNHLCCVFSFFKQYFL